MRVRIKRSFSHWLRRGFLASCALTFAIAFAADEPDALTKAAERATAEFSKRVEAATKEMADVRARIAQEKAPLIEASRVAEDQIVVLGPEIAELQSGAAAAEARSKRLQSDRFTLQKNINYLNTLARDGLKMADDGLLPGEPPQIAEKIATLTSQLESPGERATPAASVETLEFMLARFRDQLGGYATKGKSLVGDGNKLVNGAFAFVGPEVFFRSDDGSVAGTVRSREGSTYPITFPLPAWKQAQAAGFFNGQLGSMPADASGGKALRLRETNGTIFEHIDRGGPVAYIIIGVGLFAFALAVQKFVELRRLKVDSPVQVRRVLDTIFEESTDAQARTLGPLKGTTRELFALGLRHLNKPKETLEEHLFAFTLRTRLQYERRLPLLAVIATASPLMGLLGTVMGMIKTFALITVFGTGNAAKLSSGISEVLVTTELGLTVAIPALIAHGFLAHRAQKKLSSLERYAVEFVAAAGDARGTEPAGEELSSV
jgi:biopolymer transport protein ExbB